MRSMLLTLLPPQERQAVRGRDSYVGINAQVTKLASVVLGAGCGVRVLGDGHRAGCMPLRMHCLGQSTQSPGGGDRGDLVTGSMDT